MKRTIVIVVLATSVLACKKNKDDVAQPSLGVLQKDTKYADQNAYGTQVDLEIGRFTYTTDNSGQPIEFADTYDGTVPFENFSDLRIVFSNGTDSVVATDTGLGTGWWSDHIPAKKNTVYRISVYVSVQALTIGTLTPYLQFQQGNNQTEMMAGQTTTFRYYKISPVVTSAAAATTLTTNGSDISLGSVTVSAPDGAIASKAFAWRVQFADNGANDTLKLVSLLFFKNGQDITNQVTFVDSLGNRVTDLSELTPSHNKFFVVCTAGIGESVTQKGAKDVFDPHATVQGLGASADGDAIRITPVTDNTLPPTGAGYPVKVTNTNDYRPRLGTGPKATSGTIVNYLWSDMSESPHSGIYTVASGDWKNGVGITFNSSSIIYHSRYAVSRSVRRK